MTQQLVSIPSHGSSITATSDQRVAIDRRTFTTCAPLPRVVIVALLLITSACGSTVGPRDESHDPQQPFVMPPLVDASGHPLPDLQQGRDWR